MASLHRGVSARSKSRGWCGWREAEPFCRRRQPATIVGYMLLPCAREAGWVALLGRVRSPEGQEQLERPAGLPCHLPEGLWSACWSSVPVTRAGKWQSGTPALCVWLLGLHSIHFAPYLFGLVGWWRQLEARLGGLKPLETSERWG